MLVLYLVVVTSRLQSNSSIIDVGMRNLLFITFGAVKIAVPAPILNRMLAVFFGMDQSQLANKEAWSMSVLLVSFLLVVFLGAMATTILWRQMDTRFRDSRWLCAFSWLVLGLAPPSLGLGHYITPSSRYLYLPSVGGVMLVAGLVAVLEAGSRRRLSYVGISMLASMVIAHLLLVRITAVDVASYGHENHRIAVYIAEQTRSIRDIGEIVAIAPPIGLRDYVREAIVVHSNSGWDWQVREIRDSMPKEHTTELGRILDFRLLGLGDGRDMP
ncbi:MAG: hypothetical protein HPY69_01475 [Armatimonadetes bacterium]|nr:hypothetical protein [Armatimonadota bacterium]